MTLFVTSGDPQKTRRNALCYALVLETPFWPFICLYLDCGYRGLLPRVTLHSGYEPKSLIMWHLAVVTRILTTEGTEIPHKGVSTLVDL